MAKQTIKTVAGNTAPPLELTCERDDGTGTLTVIDLTSCTVKLYIYKGKTQTNTGHETCTITGASTGDITYVRSTGDTSVAGSYICDIKVTYSDTTFEILYDQLILKCRKLSGT